MPRCLERVAETPSQPESRAWLSCAGLATLLGHGSLDLWDKRNCHKWLCAPKGAGFLWAHPEHQGWIAPLVISSGYHEEADFAERHGWLGTRDPAAYLAVPKAIEVHASFDLARSRALADEAERRLAELGLERVAGVPAPFMRSVELPPGDAAELWQRLYEGFRVEVPVFERDGRRLLRFSIAPYNDEDDVDRLVTALRQLL